MALDVLLISPSFPTDNGHFTKALHALPGVRILGVGDQPAAAMEQGVRDAIDALTKVDAQVFASALRLLLGRLGTVRERTGTDLLQCINWRKLYESSSHIAGLWAAPGALVCYDEQGERVIGEQGSRQCLGTSAWD